ncbi:MAG: methyltransferase domain-containing protein [Saprospiraceae bacterium]|nr:methyltransferase domain-containing protein [Candidatus Vicinibacter affinis]
MDQNFWESRWEQKLTGWDIGHDSPPLINYMLQVPDKSVKILIPGCGNAHETEILLNLGFKDIHLMDIAKIPADQLRKKFANHPEVTVHWEDFFKHEGAYEIILEQTFFCAINPELRKKYVEKCHKLLNQGGKLVGLLFNKVFDDPGPPFGGSEKEYRAIFKELFNIHTMEPCRNSILPRQNSELFFILTKKEI